MALNAVLFSNIPGDSSSYPFSGGTLPTAEECGFVYADHTFDHWNTSSDDSGNTYYAGDTFFVGPGMDTLYAIWSGVEAHDVVISYQGADIATLDSTGSAVLATDGTLMADDVTISYTKSAAPVTSVNGKTGAVVLTAADVGASTSDVKVTQAPVAAGSLTLWRPVVLGYQGKSSEDTSFSDATNSVLVNDSVRYQPSTGTLKATTFKGNLTGDVTGTASGNVKPGIMEILNPFSPVDRVYIDRLDNALYFADKRWTVTGYQEDSGGTQTALTSSQIANLFDMAEVDNSIPAAGNKAVITIDFSGPNGTDVFPNYPYGRLVLDFYYTKAPDSVSVRVYGKHTGTTPYWADVSVTNNSKGTTAIQYIATQTGMYNMMKLEITVQAKSSSAASLSEISYFLNRANKNKDMPYFSKLRAEKLYYSPTAPDYLLSDGRSVATALNSIPSSYVTSVNGNTGAVTIPDEVYIGTTTPTDSGVDVWIDTGSSGTLQNVVCSVNGISPTSGGNVDLIPGDRPTYYIDGTNGSDSNDGSESRPFATINKALDLIKGYKIQTIYPAIVYIAEGTYDEFLDLRRLPLELNLNLQGDVTISGILCVHSACFINGDSNGGHKLTVEYSSNVTYPWGKTLINVSQGSTFDIKSGSSGSVELKTTDNTVMGIWVGRECNSYIQKVVFTGTFAFPISIENTEAKIGSIVSSGTNIGRIRESGTLFIGDINGGVNYTGTTIDATSRIIFKPVKSVCSKTPDANGDVALVSSDVGAMGAWTLLWSNASPTSSFAAQTVAIDLSNYDFVAVKFLADTSSSSILYNKMQIRVVRVGDGGWAEHLLTASTDWPGGAYNGIRPFETSSSGVTFSACLERGSTHNTTEIPQEIYGIKGIITAIS